MGPCMMEDMEPHQKQERSHSQEKKTAGCAIFAVIIVGVAVAVVVVGAVVMMVWTRKAAMVEGEAAMPYAETLFGASEAAHAAGEEAGMVMLSADSIGKISATDFGDELSREQFVAVMADDQATDLMREQFEEKANGMRVKWLLRVEEVAAPDSKGAIKASLGMPYRIRTGSGWRGSSVSVKAEFGPDAVDDLLKVRRGQWVTLQGKLAIDSNGRGARILAARVADPRRAAPAEREN